MAEDKKLGRPRNQMRRADILRAAMRLMGTYGYEGTSLRAIAAQIGISEALVRRYFPKKCALLDALRESVVDHVDEFLRDLYDYETIAQTQPYLTAVAERYEHFIMESHDAYMLWLLDSRLMEPYSQTFVSYLTMVRERVIDGILRRMDVERERAEKAVYTLFAATFGNIIFSCRLGPAAVQAAHLVEAVLPSLTIASAAPPLDH